MAFTVIGNNYNASWDNASTPLQKKDPTTKQKIQKVLSWGLSLNPLIGLSYLVNYALGRLANKMLLPATYLKPSKDMVNFDTLLIDPLKVTNHKITTPDGAELDVTLIRSPEGLHSESKMLYDPEEKYLYPEKAPTIIHFNGNAEVSPTGSPPIPWFIQEAVRKKIAYNFVFFTYRGVGKSKGTFTSPKDLILDGYSILQWVRENLETRDNDIHFYGVSLGGAIAAETQALDPDNLTGNHFNVRSFASTDKFAEAFSFGTLWLRKMLRRVFNNHGYRMNPKAACNKLKGKKIIVYHPQDPIIPYGASMAASLPKKISKNSEIIKVELGETARLAKQDHEIDFHNIPINFFEGAVKELSKHL